MQRDTVLRGLVVKWVHKAETDLQACDYLLERPSVLGGIIAFHAQQGVEKYMKAALTWHQVEFPKTHDLGDLLTLLANEHASLRDELLQTVVLTDYGVETRYPGDLPDVTPEEAREAVRLAVHARDVIRAFLPTDLLTQ